MEQLGSLSTTKIKKLKKNKFYPSAFLDQKSGALPPCHELVNNKLNKVIFCYVVNFNGI